MNKKRFVLASLAVFVAVVVMEYVANVILLAKLYETTANLWRPMADIDRMKPYGMIVYFLAAFVFAYIYAKGCESKPSPALEGMRFGFWIGLFVVPSMATWTYITMPIPLALAVSWFVIGMAEYLVLGAIVGMIYKKPAVV